MANELPSNVSYGTIVGRFLIAYQDGSDVDLYPDGVPASGSIFFSPSVESLKNPTATPAPVTILPTVIECGLDSEGYLVGANGNRGISLIATNDTDNNPTGWTWNVSYKLTGPDGNPLRGIGSYDLSVPAGQTIDLITNAPVEA